MKKKFLYRVKTEGFHTGIIASSTSELEKFLKALGYEDKIIIHHLIVTKHTTRVSSKLDSKVFFQLPLD